MYVYRFIQEMYHIFSEMCRNSLGNNRIVQSENTVFINKCLWLTRDIKNYFVKKVKQKPQFHTNSTINVLILLLRLYVWFCKPHG